MLKIAADIEENWANQGGVLHRGISPIYLSSSNEWKPCHETINSRPRNLKMALEKFFRFQWNWKIFWLGCFSTFKTTFSISCNLITKYNPLLPNLKTIIRKHLPILYSNQQMLDIFPHNTISVTYKRNKNVREILSPSLFPRTTKKNEC